MSLTAVLSALSDPIRLRVVTELAQAAEARVCSSFVLPVTKATMTHHFRVLRQSGVICQEEQGTRRLNRLRRDELDERFPGLLAAVLRGASQPGAFTWWPCP